jgi:tRNA pseudouridine55 synthase
LQQVKRLFGAGKAGHAGTLDPLASGLLVVLFGEATKFAGPALDADKEYVATLKLGERTSTGDAEGAVVERKDVPPQVEKQLPEILQQFKGDLHQVPPMYSALKQDGEALYKRARRGETVERAPRKVRIGKLELLSFTSPFLEIRVRCSKGTYVRVLAEDLGAALGTAAHLVALRRTGSGRYRVEGALTLEALAALEPQARLQRLLPLASLLEDLPRAELDAQGEDRLRKGQALKVGGLGEGICGVFGPGGSVIGLGEASVDGVLRALRLTQVPEKHVKSRA